MAELIDPKLQHENLVRKGYVGAVEINDDEQAIIARITTDRIDRDNEVILPRGIDTTEWHKTRVVMWVHDYLQPPVGLGLWLKKEPNGVLSKYEPAPTDFAHEIYDLYKARVLRSFSIGFLPKEWVDEHTNNEQFQALLKKHPEWEGVRRIYTKIELLEFSCVPIGSNPDALTVAVGKGLILSEGTKKAVGFVEPPPKPELETKDAIAELDKIAKLTLELPGKAVTIAEGMKPFPNEHSCRLLDPAQFERFSRDECQQKHDGKCIAAILGIKEDKSQIQALRYKKDIWTVGDARAHCKTREGSFEAAGEAERAAVNMAQHQLSKDKAFEQQKEIIGSQTKTISVLQGALRQANKEIQAGAKLLVEAQAQTETAKEIAHEYIRYTTGRIT